MAESVVCVQPFGAGSAWSEGAPTAVTPSTATKLFEERAEHVYFLAPRHLQTFVRCVGEHVGVEFFHRSETDIAEPPAHYLTTLYFDTDDRAIARACEAGDENVKLRARQYCDLDPATGMQHEPFLWIEVKTRTGTSTRKRRFSIPLHDVHACLHDGVITESTLRFQRRAWGPSAEPVLEAILQLCQDVARPLRPDCLAHYRRQAWQDVGERMRITVDTELGFHRVLTDPSQQGMTGTTLSDAVAGPPVAELPLALVEIKLRREPPTWLSELITDVGLEPARVGPRAFSKFLAASHAVHADPDALAAIHD